MCASEMYHSRFVLSLLHTHRYRYIYIYLAFKYPNMKSTEKKEEKCRNSHMNAKMNFFGCVVVCHFRLCVCFVLSHVRRKISLYKSLEQVLFRFWELFFFTVTKFNRLMMYFIAKYIRFECTQTTTTTTTKNSKYEFIQFDFFFFVIKCTAHHHRTTTKWRANFDQLSMHIASHALIDYVV